jgi:hypothetical protein
MRSMTNTPERYTIITQGRRPFPGSRVIQDEVVCEVAEDDRPAEPVSQRVSLTEALMWLSEAGYEAEGMEAGLGIATWKTLTGPAQLDVKRQCTFLRSRDALPRR